MIEILIPKPGETSLHLRTANIMLLLLLLMMFLALDILRTGQLGLQGHSQAALLLERLGTFAGREPNPWDFSGRFQCRCSRLSKGKR